MGRTVPTYRNHLESLIASWGDYRRALRKGDRRLFDAVVTKMRQHASAAGFCAHLDPVETALLSVLLEMEREIGALRARPPSPEGASGEGSRRENG
jgi:hypothetical protein